MSKLIFLPGWGYRASVMQPLADCFGDEFAAECQDLPQDFERWLESIEQGSWLIGWSLGGMLAAQAAARLKERCAGLILLGTNLSFVQSAKWQWAMPDADFQAFANSLQQSPQQCLRRFAMLCAQGASEPKALNQLLRQHLLPADSPQLATGLQLLQQLDISSSLHDYQGAKLMLFAQQDALLPVVAAEQVSRLYPQEMQVEQLAGSHAFVLEHAEQVAAIIRDWIKP